jgi:hypothetical protein
MLLNSLNEIKSVLPVGAGNDFQRLKVHLQNAETAFIIPLLGNNLYDELEEFYLEPPEGELTEVQLSVQSLLTRVQHAIVHLGYFLGFDFLNISVSDMGFSRLESDRAKSLYKYQEDNLREYFRNSGFNALDDILVFLEENIAHFGEFKASPSWTVFRQSFIPTARVFNEICFINNSRLTFLRMRPHMSHVEETRVLPILGQEIFDFIKSEMVKDEPAPKVLAILPLIRRAIAWLSSALLMEESGADLTDRGLYFTATWQSYYENHKISPSSADRIALLVSRNRQTGENFLQGIRSHLAAHPEDWPTAVVTSEIWNRRDNTDKKTFWV